MFQTTRQYFSTLKSNKFIKHGPSNFWMDALIILLTGWLMLWGLSLIGGQFLNNSKQELAAISAPILPLLKAPTISQTDQTNRIAAAKAKQAQFMDGVQNEVALWAFDSQYRNFRIFSLTLLGILLFFGATSGVRVLVGGIGALMLWTALLLL